MSPWFLRALTEGGCHFQGGRGIKLSNKGLSFPKTNSVTKSWVTVPSTSMPDWSKPSQVPLRRVQNSGTGETEQVTTKSSGDPEVLKNDPKSVQIRVTDSSLNNSVISSVSKKSLLDPDPVSPGFQQTKKTVKTTGSSPHTETHI